jgi:ribosome biogenesis GTPase
MLSDWGYGGSETAGVARVVSAHGDYFHLVCNEREGEIIARKKASAFRELPPPITGDFVEFDYNPHGESRILSVKPRFSELFRLDPSSSGYKAQVLAVNFDTLFFAVPSVDARSEARPGRFLAIAEASGCLSRVVVLSTKSDLAGCASAVPELLQPVKSIAVSSVTGDGLDAVREYVRPRATVAFIGPSGAGKSSLVNALAGEEWMATGEIQEWSGKGRHTTTSRELVMLPCGAMALDTPGLREVGVFGEDGFELKGRLGGTHRYRR